MAGIRRTALIVLFLCLAPAASADWLVMKDGGRVETRGEWKIKGQIVVFTQKNGTLSSVRLSEVDLDQSAEATYEAENPPAEESAEEAPKEAVIEITDEDIPEALPTSGDAGSPTGDPEGGEASSGAGPSRENVSITDSYELLTWNVQAREQGVEIVGTLAYRGEEEIVDGLNMIVVAQTPDGYVLGETSAALRTRMLRTGAATSFRAVFPELDPEADYQVVVDVESQPPLSDELP